MRESEVLMFETALEVSKVLGEKTFEVHHFDDGSYVDILTKRVDDVAEVLRAANNHELKFFSCENLISIRFYEKF